jgi:hypothetical protein
MTMIENTVRPDGLTAIDGQLALSVRLPWYRSLPLSCLESIDVSVDGRGAELVRLELAEFTGALPEAQDSEIWWDLREPLRALVQAPAEQGDVVACSVTLTVRIPYIQVADGRPYVQHATNHVTGVVQ